ncbi:MAG TPA: HNH endonuclease signature motif containing protein [Ignavibacteriales bacterium]|nr:HNH endonuclease signature motif containing protein [Ignavibacteriales bacterium]
MTGQTYNWTPEQIRFVKENFETMPWKTMVKELGLNSATPLMSLKKRLGLKRSKKNNKQIILDSRFKKGHKPVYLVPKGTRLSPATEFKKGHIPKNTLYDGCIIIRSDHKKRNGRKYKWIRISQGKWVPLHKHIWEKKHGKVPKGKILSFKNGDSLDVRLGNLKLITRAENVRSNFNPKKLSAAMKKLWKANHHLTRDSYIAHTLAPGDPELKKELLNHPDLIELKRMSLTLKRSIKNAITKNSA